MKSESSEMASVRPWEVVRGRMGGAVVRPESRIRRQLEIMTWETPKLVRGSHFSVVDNQFSFQRCRNLLCPRPTHIITKTEELSSVKLTGEELALSIRYQTHASLRELRLLFGVGECHFGARRKGAWHQLPIGKTPRSLLRQLSHVLRKEAQQHEHCCARKALEEKAWNCDWRMQRG